MHIIPRVGLDNVVFGLTREQVRQLVGTPEQVSPGDYGDGDATEAWYFRARGVSYHFDSDCDWRLTTIEVDSPEATLHGSRLVGMSWDELREFLRSHDVYWSKEDAGRIEVDHWSMNIWLEDGRVESVQWGVPFDDQNNEVWPSQSAV